MKRPVLIAMLCLCASLLVMFFGFHGTSQSAPVKTHSITLLTQEDTGSFLLQLRYGADAAAGEAGDKLSVATLDPNDPASQIEQLKEDGVAAVLLYAGEDTLVSEVAQACAGAGMPLVLLGRTAEKEGYAASDEEQAGVLAAQQAKSLNATHVICMLDNSALANARFAGVVKELGNDNGAIVQWYGWQYAQTLPEDVRLSTEQNAVVLALTGDAMLAAVRMRREGMLSTGNPMIGIDGNPDNVTLLEQGQVSALVLPAPYTISYRGCRLAIAALDGGTTKSALVEPRLITLDNLYDAQNVNITFPLLQ